MNHLSEETIEALAMGETPADSVEVRRHLAQCASCAALLEREAQLEMLFHSAAGSPAAPARASRIAWRGGLQFAAGLLLLVGGGLWVAHARRSPSPIPHASQRVDSLAMKRQLGRDVESPRDYGRWAGPYAPGLEQSTTGGPPLSDSL